MKRTRTNRPFGLAIFFNPEFSSLRYFIRAAERRFVSVSNADLPFLTKIWDLKYQIWNRFIPGGFSGGVTPDPISNSEVKPTRADGSDTAGYRESRSPPGLFFTSGISSEEMFSQQLWRACPDSNKLGAGGRNNNEKANRHYSSIRIVELFFDFTCNWNNGTCNADWSRKRGPADLLF